MTTISVSKTINAPTRALTPLMKKMFTRGMTAHLDVVAQHCERSSA